MDFRLLQSHSLFPGLLSENLIYFSTRIADENAIAKRGRIK